MLIFIVVFSLALFFTYAKMKEKELISTDMTKDEFKDLMKKLKNLSPKEMDKLVSECEEWASKKKST